MFYRRKRTENEYNVAISHEYKSTITPTMSCMQEAQQQQFEVLVLLPIISIESLIQQDSKS